MLSGSKAARILSCHLVVCLVTVYLSANCELIGPIPVPRYPRSRSLAGADLKVSLHISEGRIQSIEVIDIDITYRGETLAPSYPDYSIFRDGFVEAVRQALVRWVLVENDHRIHVVRFLFSSQMGPTGLMSTSIDYEFVGGWDKIPEVIKIDLTLGILNDPY